MDYDIARSGPSSSSNSCGAAAAAAAKRCSGCSNRVPKAELAGQCGGCGLVRYCSRDCQWRDWPSHKPNCASLAALRHRLGQPENRASKRDVSAVSKWLDVWQDMVVAYSVLGMDLKSHPTRLKTHAVFLDMRMRTPRPREMSKWLQVEHARIMPRADLISMVKSNPTYRTSIAPHEITETLLPVPDTSMRMLIAMMCSGHLWVFAAAVSHQYIAQLSEGALLQGFPRTMWNIALKSAVNSGQPSLVSTTHVVLKSIVEVGQRAEFPTVNIRFSRPGFR